jgi:branched-chain amino acid transport system ATP-binding protein
MYHIPQENFIFNNLSVEDNLELALFTARDKSGFESKYREVYEIFPILKERQNQLAGTLSGGERRILSIGMGFLRQPNFLMLDEPSGGLSPIAFKNVVKIIEEINRKIGTAILIVEQNVKVTFRICKRVYVMKAGHVILEETGQKLLERNSWWDLF